MFESMNQAETISKVLQSVLVIGGGIIISAVLLLKYNLSKRKKFVPLAIAKVIIIGITVVFTIIVLISGVLLYGIKTSRLPDALSMIDHHNLDYGGGRKYDHHSSHHGGGEQSVSVTSLTGGVENEKPDKSYTLVAETVTSSLSSGKKIETWRYTGSEGSDLRVRQNEIIEVKLVNKNISQGVTIHWHGYNVPNAMDGVAGMTQDAVMPGQSFTYKFRAKDAGTYWFHSHQQSMVQVYKGLFGTLIVEPETELFPYDVEILVPLHVWVTNHGLIPAVGLSDTLQRKKVKAGENVRVRLINTDNIPHEFSIVGTGFKVVAVDGLYIDAPAEIESKKLVLAAGGRYDISFQMPDDQVEIKQKVFPINVFTTSFLLSTDGNGEATAGDTPNEVLQLENYGTPQKPPFDLSSNFNRKFNMILDSKFGFYNGMPAYLWTINGEVFPDTPTFVVKEGDLAKVYIENRSPEPHPMHLHGHHVLVLSKNGKAIAGSPWWTDSLNVAPGERFEIGFIADNPGMWMDHCHNLQHASVGMALHVMYEGITTPFMIGKKTGNMPE